MAWLVTITLDVVLAFALLCSLSMAGAWGELCGIRPSGDKSGLGGFTMVLLLAIVRWLAFALALAVVARPGERTWLLAAHAGLGVAATWSFSRLVDRVHGDRTVPAALGAAIGVGVPLPALTLALVRLHGAGRHDAPLVFALTAVALAALHGLVFHQRRRGMRPRGA